MSRSPPTAKEVHDAVKHDFPIESDRVVWCWCPQFGPGPHEHDNMHCTKLPQQKPVKRGGK